MGGAQADPGTQAGVLDIDLNIRGTRLDSGHDVDEDQREPGVAAEAQPSRHELSFTIFDATTRFAYGLTDRLRVSLGVPVRTIAIEVEFEDEMGGVLDFDSIHHRTERLTGLGDLSLDADYMWNATDVWLSVGAGASVPTGRTEPNPFTLGRAGERHQHSVFGSGTVDPRVTVGLGWRLGPLTLIGGGSAKGALYENEHGYKTGWKFVGHVGASSGFGLTSWTFRMSGGLYHERASTWSGEAARNSGRTDALLSAGVSWLPASTWRVGVDVTRPFVVGAQGGQLEIPLTVGLSVGTSFNVSK